MGTRSTLQLRMRLPPPDTVARHQGISARLLDVLKVRRTRYTCSPLAPHEPLVLRDHCADVVLNSFDNVRGNVGTTILSQLRETIAVILDLR